MTDVAEVQVSNQTLALAGLTAHKRNYNRHPAGQVERIAASLRQFGQPRSIVVWRGTILAGHGVVEAARALGWQTIRADVLPDDYPEHLALAYVVADNELGRLSDPDQAALAAILEESREADAGLLEAMGYDDKEFDALLAQLDRNSGQDAEPQETEAERLQAEWGTAPGQLWQLGAHRVLCGDSTDPATWARLMRGEQANVVWTDPPYGVDYVSKSKALNQNSVHVQSAMDIHADGDADTAIAATRAALTLACANSRPGGAIYMCAPPGAHMTGFIAAFVEAGFEHHQTLIWVKNSIVLGRSDYHYQHEPVIYGWKPGAHTWLEIMPGRSVVDDEQSLRRMDKAALIALVEQMRNERRSDVIRISKPHSSRLHQTAKPVELVALTMKNNAAPGDLVIDPFAGSGSTLIAATQTERRCFAIEMEPAYTAVILQRWADATNQTPTLVAP